MAVGKAVIQEPQCQRFDFPTCGQVLSLDKTPEPCSRTINTVQQPSGFNKVLYVIVTFPFITFTKLTSQQK